MPEYGFDKHSILSKIGVLNGDNLTNAGKTLFSQKHPIVLKMAVFATEHKETFLDIARKEGNLFQLIDAAVGYIIKNIRWRVEMEGDGIHRKEIPEIPINALRKAVINSFAHARYDLPVQHEIDVFISDSESEDNIASSIYQSIAEIRDEYPRKCKTLFKHRVVTIPSSELILPQDLGEVGSQIVSFYAQHGYLAGFAVHTDTYYVHLHIIVFTTNCTDGSGFHIPYEWKNLNYIVGKWYYQHNQRLENNLRFREQQEKILYGNPGYGELAVFSNNQIRQNKKKHHGNGHH